MAEQNLDTNVTIQLNTQEFAEKWAPIMVDRLYQGLDKYNIGKLDGALWNSIKSQVLASNGDVDSIITKFLQYGRFVDMGVGRGVPIGAAGTAAFSAARNDNGSLRKYHRSRKPWYSKAYYSEVQRFTELYADMFNKQVPVQIQEALNATINISV
jgi:hypothetical protein